MSIKEIAISTVEVSAKTVLSTIPGGALLTNIYDAVKGGCLDKRRIKWQDEIESRLSTLEKTLDDVGNSENFTTVLIKATEIAMKTASEEKRIYLANAVLNSAESNIEEEKLIVFLDLIDKYTVSHIKIIHFFFNPRAFVDASSYYMGSPTTPLFDVYPELNNKLFNKIYKDLYIDGMITLDNPNISMSGSGMVAKRTTPLADELLRFISKNT